jgi:hypothetical protein
MMTIKNFGKTTDAGQSRLFAVGLLAREHMQLYRQAH